MQTPASRQKTYWRVCQHVPAPIYSYNCSRRSSGKKTCASFCLAHNEWVFFCLGSRLSPVVRAALLAETSLAAALTALPSALLRPISAILSVGICAAVLSLQVVAFELLVSHQPGSSFPMHVARRFDRSGHKRRTHALRHMDCHC